MGIGLALAGVVVGVMPCTTSPFSFSIISLCQQSERLQIKVENNDDTRMSNFLDVI